MIHERGRVTVAAFMDLALYDPTFGYYARAPRRSGRAGDFFTSVDVGALFGDLIEVQIAEMADRLDEGSSGPARDLDLVEVGAGSGQLAADLLRAALARHPSLYGRLRLHLVEKSAAARARHHETLGECRDRLASSSEHLPASFEGVLLANELIDAMPVHQVVMREEGLRELYVQVSNGQLTTVEGDPSTPALAEYLAGNAVRLESGWRAEVNLTASTWIADVARRLRRGFVVLLDYGHEARDLYSARHAGGTLTTYRRHASAEPAAAGPPTWIHHPGDQDLTAHVNFTGVRRAAEDAGLVTLGFLDQTYFLLGLIDPAELDQPAHSIGQLRRRLALRTLVAPDGLGGTMKVLIFGRDVGRPHLRGCGPGRVT